MSADFGVEPTQKEYDYYFVSYNTEDADRVGKICRFMHSVHPEIDFWYDKGIRHDDQWSAKIAQKIDKCKEMIFSLPAVYLKKALKDLKMDSIKE